MRDGRFEVGDIVIANNLADNRYSVTKDGWKGTVIKVKDNYALSSTRDNTITVRACPGYKGNMDFEVNHKCFDLYLPADAVIIKGVTMPTCCGECFALDESGCRFCKVNTAEFHIWTDRASNCPMTDTMV